MVNVEAYGGMEGGENSIAWRHGGREE